MTRIVGIRRLDETTWRSGGSGDNWHTTWADDDRQYVSLCDGCGWPEMSGHTGKLYNTRAFALDGAPPNHSFEHLPGYPDLFTGSRYYGFGILAVDGRIYEFLSTPNRPFDRPDPRFVGAKLIFSPDRGRSWRNQDGSPARWEEWPERSRRNMAFFEEPDDAFSLLSVLQMGRNYEHNRDGYVYVYAPNGNRDGEMNRLVMFRAPKGRLLDRASYEYFVSLRRDGTVQWSPRIEDRGVVHAFPPGWVNAKVHPYAWHPCVVYNAPLGLYMMVNWGMGCGGDGLWFEKPGYLGLWTAATPWGPWDQVHEETAWTPAGDPNARAYQPQIPPKWIASDGKSFTLVWTDFQQIGEGRPYYCFNCQKAEIMVR